MLGGVEAIHVATVLEDCIDQLAILGKIMPASYELKPNADEVVDDEISELVDNQNQVEAKFEEAVSQKQGRGRLQAMTELRQATRAFGRGLKQSPLTPDNMDKVQQDRAFLEKVLQDTLMELSQGGTYQTLIDAVALEQDRKAKLQDVIQKEEESRRTVKRLQKQLVEIRKEKEDELTQRNEMIAHLKDQLQEMKAKTNMEGKYVKKCAEVTVFQNQKRCNMSEQEHREQIQLLRRKIDEETRVNAEIESYLRTHQSELEQKVEYWMEKYEKDVEAKQHELDVLKASKAKDLERLQELTRLYGEYEQVVVEDRIEKEKARRQAEAEAMELEAAVKIQSWFRGVMVRRGLGPYAKKKKKGKKGKKSGKKKKNKSF